jgi:hypothetical protein
MGDISYKGTPTIKDVNIDGIGSINKIDWLINNKI